MGRPAARRWRAFHLLAAPRPGQASVELRKGVAEFARNIKKLLKGRGDEITIGAFTGHWNDHPRPFTWTKDADEILAKIERAKAKQAPLHTTSVP